MQNSSYYLGPEENKKFSILLIIPLCDSCNSDQQLIRKFTHPLLCGILISAPGISPGIADSRRHNQGLCQVELTLQNGFAIGNHEHDLDLMI